MRSYLILIALVLAVVAGVVMAEPFQLEEEFASAATTDTTSFDVSMSLCQISPVGADIDVRFLGASGTIVLPITASPDTAFTVRDGEDYIFNDIDGAYNVEIIRASAAAVRITATKSRYQ